MARFLWRRRAAHARRLRLPAASGAQPPLRFVDIAAHLLEVNEDVPSFIREFDVLQALRTNFSSGGVLQPPSAAAVAAAAPLPAKFRNATRDILAAHAADVAAPHPLHATHERLKTHWRFDTVYTTKSELYPLVILNRHKIIPIKKH